MLVIGLDWKTETQGPLQVMLVAEGNSPANPAPKPAEPTPAPKPIHEPTTPASPPTDSTGPIALTEYLSPQLSIQPSPSSSTAIEPESKSPSRQVSDVSSHNISAASAIEDVKTTEPEKALAAETHVPAKPPRKQISVDATTSEHTHVDVKPLADASAIQQTSPLDVKSADIAPISKVSAVSALKTEADTPIKPPRKQPSTTTTQDHPLTEAKLAVESAIVTGPSISIDADVTAPAITAASIPATDVKSPTKPSRKLPSVKQALLLKAGTPIDLSGSDEKPSVQIQVSEEVATAAQIPPSSTTSATEVTGNTSLVAKTDDDNSDQGIKPVSDSANPAKPPRKRRAFKTQTTVDGMMSIYTR